ncbi:MAG TPA: O-methyltransferase [Thermoanaerobaculia bacterium]
MDDPRWNAVDNYINDMFVGSDSALDAALKASDDGGLPSIQVAANQGKLLMLLARAQGARRILEIGTLGGYSTIWLARALPAGGRLITLELDQKHATVARSNIARAGLAEKVEVRVGPALESLKKLVAEKAEPFDFVFIDADKTGYPDYLSWSLKLSHRGTMIIADNVVRDGAIADAKSEDRSVQAVRRMNEMLAKEPRVSATVLQTVGTKGYDGWAIALVTDGDGRGNP